MANLFWKLFTVDLNEKNENQIYFIEPRKVLVYKLIVLYLNSDDFEVFIINFRFKTV